MDGTFKNPEINLTTEFITPVRSMLQCISQEDIHQQKQLICFLPQGNINDLFAKHQVPEEFDLLSIGKLQ